MDLAGLLNELAAGSNIPVLTALILGLVAAISPCPMATNIAAIAYISRRVNERRYCVVSGALYTLGRMVAYSLLGILIIVAGLEIPGVASFLQNFGGRVLGPLLIVVGLLMLFIDRLPFGRGGGRLAAFGARVAGWGVFGGFLLGVLFALAFCPYSAILFFGILIPLALNSGGGIALPAVYAIGTGLPVLIFGILVAAGVSWVSTWLNAVSRAEKVVRIVVSLIFIGVGIYYVVLWVQAASL